MIDAGVVELVTTNYLNGADPRLPTASPINGDFSGFPPLYIQVGEREVLYSDAEMLAEKAQRFGVEVVFEEWKDMVHVWHLFYPMLTAGREAMYKIGKFIIEKTA
jgi:acetyl esterase/lipase